MSNEYHPRFVEAAKELKRIAETHGEAAMYAREHAHLFRQMVEYAPPELQDIMTAKAKEMGLIPPTEHVDAQGNPVYSVEQIAAHFGLPVDEVQRDLEAFAPDGACFYAGPVHRVQ